MVDDSGVPPLPRRVPGASGSPRPPARVDLGVISEDLRQRVLTAIASELERDEAERRRNAQEQGGAGDRDSHGKPGTGHTVRAVDAPGGSAAIPANGSAAGLGVAGLGNIGPAPGKISGASPANGIGAGLDDRTGGSLDSGVGASPANAPPWDRDAPWPGTPAQQGDTPHGEAADRGRSAAEDAAVAREPGGTPERGQATDAGDAADGSAGAAPRPAVPLPRRAPGANGAPPPPAELRREYLPPSVLGRRLEPEAHTEPLPRISGTGPRSGGPAATGSGQSASSLFSPTPAAAAPPAAPAPARSPAEPEPSASGPSTAAPPGTPAEPVPPGALSAETVPPETVSPDSAPPQSALSASALAAAPTMPVGSAALAAAAAPATPAGSAALAAAAAPTMPAGAAAMAAAARFAPPAETAQTAADLAPSPARLRRPRAQRPLLRRPATAGPPIRAERGRAAAGAPVRRCRSPRPCRPPSGHGGPAGPTASLA